MPDLNRNQIAIIDYGMGNLFNVQRACASVGLRSVITADKDVITQAVGMILPGVGAFGDAMNNLTKMDLVGVIKDHIELKKPFFGICLGMQLLLTGSEEFGGHKGLDVVKGKVVKFNSMDKKNRKIKVPQVGWNRIFFNKIQPVPQRDSVLQNIPDGEYMYFVHSYYAVLEDSSFVFTKTNYENTEYCSAISKELVFATQFHPEKSGLKGLRVFENWAQIISAHSELIRK